MDTCQAARKNNMYFLSHFDFVVVVCFVFYLYRMWMCHQKKKSRADFMELKNKVTEN